MSHDNINSLLKTLDISEKKQEELINEQLKTDQNQAVLYNPFSIIKPNENLDILDRVIKKDLENEEKDLKNGKEPDF